MIFLNAKSIVKMTTAKMSEAIITTIAELCN